MRVKIDDVIVKKRIRREIKDLGPLMESMRKYGQFNPIIINRRNELLAGERRLEAARRLGWSAVDAVVLDREEELEMLEIELEENITRAELSFDEAAEGMSRLEKLRRPSIWRRLLAFIRRLLRRIFAPKLS